MRPIAHAGRAPEWKAPGPVVVPGGEARVERGLHDAVRSRNRRRAPARPGLAVAEARPETLEEEVASDFYALRPGPLVEPGEMAPLVRVRLPRSEMRRFGLPAGPEPWRTIQADVLVGHDGMARAIRFVSTGGR
jgi:hypothetical protein